VGYYFETKLGGQRWKQGEFVKSFGLAEQQGGWLKLEVCEERVEGVH
jgi:hypothetical protein